MPVTKCQAALIVAAEQWMPTRPPNWPFRSSTGAHRMKCLYNMYDKFIDNDGNAVQQSTGKKNIPARAGSWHTGTAGGRQAGILERTALSRTRVTMIRFAYKVNAEMLFLLSSDSMSVGRANFPPATVESTGLGEKVVDRRSFLHASLCVAATKSGRIFEPGSQSDALNSAIRRILNCQLIQRL